MRWVCCRNGDEEGIDIPAISFQVRGKDVTRDGFVEGMKWVSENYGIAPARMGITVTETDMNDDPDNLLAGALRDMGEHGFRMSVSAFGGRRYNRFDLTRRRIGTMRIARAFVTNVASDADQQSIVAENIAFGSEVGLNVVAEGVETQAERAMLMRLGCPAMAGPVIADPMPGYEMTDWLTGRAQVAAG